MEKNQAPSDSMKKREQFAVSLRQKKKQKILDQKRSNLNPIIKEEQTHYVGFPEFEQIPEKYM